VLTWLLAAGALVIGWLIRAVLVLQRRTEELVDARDRDLLRIEERLGGLILPDTRVIPLSDYGVPAPPALALNLPHAVALRTLSIQQRDSLVERLVPLPEEPPIRYGLKEKVDWFGVEWQCSVHVAFGVVSAIEFIAPEPLAPDMVDGPLERLFGPPTEVAPMPVALAKRLEQLELGSLIGPRRTWALAGGLYLRTQRNFLGRPYLVFTQRMPEFTAPSGIRDSSRTVD
jgi:hypothetical protein